MTTNDLSLALRPPEGVVDIARTLEHAGFSTWCVGGAVRDALLGHPSLDWDLATAATPQQVQRLFRRTIPVGIEFGTIGVLDRRGVMHEVTTFRRDVDTDGRHAVVEFGVSLNDDLARRDLTMNAIAFHPLEHRVHDPFDGRGDLDRRLVRAVGDARERMREDRLRALRAIRFAARFAFEIAPDTWRAIEESAPHLGRLSPERVKQELQKTMEQVTCPSRAFARWRNAGAFAALVPALASVSDETLLAVDMILPPHGAKAEQRRSLRLAMLFSELDGAGTAKALRALRFSNAEISWLSALVERWDTLHGDVEGMIRDQRVTDATMRMVAARIGRLRVASFARMAHARWSSARTRGERLPGAYPAPTAHDTRALYRRLHRAAFHDAIEVADLAVDGDDLRAAGIAPGPQLGRVLALLLQRVLVSPTLNTHVELLRLAREFAALPPTVD